MDLELHGRVAIVTGGSRGIGKAIARELAREGATVAIVARTADALETAAAELRDDTHGTVVPVPGDTGTDDSVRHMVAEVKRQLGRIDILVNCGAAPGSTVAFPLPQITSEAFHEQLNVKVIGYLRCAREVAPHMIERGWGRIISISGMAARRATSIVGSGRNAAVVAMSKSLAEELAPHGINVTVVHPGGTLTERYEASVQRRMSEQGISREDSLRAQFDENLLGRPMTPQEVAWVVAFLASPKSITITGEVIGTGGGLPHAIFY
ncbi:MAG: SDR family oxidoreductase [Chloroflexi bacterium]|nr:SDR family oxidoreductase [Chloroflexota bacterium]